MEPERSKLLRCCSKLVGIGIRIISGSDTRTFVIRPVFHTLRLEKTQFFQFFPKFSNPQIPIPGWPQTRATLRRFVFVFKYRYPCLDFRAKQNSRPMISGLNLFGKNGKLEKSFEADALNTSRKTVLEVEAGRGVTNHQFLKDLNNLHVREISFRYNSDRFSKAPSRLI